MTILCDLNIALIFSPWKVDFRCLFFFFFFPKLKLIPVGSYYWDFNGSYRDDVCLIKIKIDTG